MKILHIWDQAGVACILTKHQRILGHDVTILKRAGYDPFGIFEFYRESLLDIDGKSFIKNAIKQAAEFDVIHVHSLYKIIPDLRRKYRDKILILHFHGSEARKAPKDPIQEQAMELSDAVIGSTEDLAQYVGYTFPIQWIQIISSALPFPWSQRGRHLLSRRLAPTWNGLSSTSETTASIATSRLSIGRQIPFRIQRCHRCSDAIPLM
jgi:hypothetical protein